MLILDSTYSAFIVSAIPDVFPPLTIDKGIQHTIYAVLCLSAMLIDAPSLLPPCCIAKCHCVCIGPLGVIVVDFTLLELAFHRGHGQICLRSHPFTVA